MEPHRSRLADPQSMSRIEWTYILCAVTLVGFLWIPPMGASLWLDETVTAWWVDAPAEVVIDRADSFSGGNPTYYLIVKAFVDVLGKSEWVYRVPSFLAMLGCLWLLYLLGSRWKDRETGLLAILPFASLQLISFESHNARTYAIGLCFTMASWLATQNLVRSWRYRDAILTGVFAAMVFHIHYVLVLGLLVNVAEITMAVIRQKRLPLAQLLVGALAFGIACLPSLSFFLDLARQERRKTLIVTPTPSYRQMWRDLLPSSLSISVVVGLIISGTLANVRHSESEEPVTRWDLFRLGAMWFLVPFTVFAVSTLTFTRIYIPRYFISFAVGMALAVAMGIRSFGPPKVRVTIAIVVTAMAIGTWHSSRHHDNDWRGVSEGIRRELEAYPEAAVLAHTGLVEAKDHEWFVDPEKRAYLNAPFMVYPVNAEVTPLPYHLKPEDCDYIRKLLDREIEKRRPFLVVSRRSFPELPLFVDGYVRGQGYESTPLRGQFGNLTVSRFIPTP